MEHPNDTPVVCSDVDVMDVSPATHPDNLTPADDNKENNSNAEVDPDNPLMRKPVTQNPTVPLTHPVPPPNQQTPPTNPPPQVAAPANLTDDENRDTQFTYVLRRYDTIAEHKVYSPFHFFGGYKWRLLIFPKGNHTSNHDLSVYLECGGPSTREEEQAHTAGQPVSPNGKDALSTPPTPNWSRPAKFSLHLLHPTSPVAKAAIAGQPVQDNTLSDLDVADSNPMAVNPRSDIVKETSHIFRSNISDWGFLEFSPFTMLQPGGHVDADMNVVLMVKIRLHDASMDPVFANTTPWDSRKETGLVGFKNQGATCYMNSLLQTLYMVSAFRRAVYEMPLPEPGNENSGSELSYALQKVFYELQFSPTVVKTKKLTESFGWDTTDAFTQHDVQELKLILCDELAEKMKKIAPEQPNTLSILFQGKLLNYIECVNVPYKSAREEEFSDLSLNVKGCKNIYESFEKYTEVEMMEGDNKYRADGFEELQDARKGVKFLKLPPVLQLHLKRFEYDTRRDAMVKVNDRYEFDTEIDLSRFVESSDDNDVYVLHSVLVHIGDVNGGHYHVFIRPKIETAENAKDPSKWYKFDDENVSVATEEAAVQENYGVGGEKDVQRRMGLEDDMGNGGLHGGQSPPPSVFQTRKNTFQNRRLSNAYMLQYLRKADVHYLLKPKSDADVPKELEERILKEKDEEEQRKRDSTEQHLYMSIGVAINEDMLQHHDADLVSWDKVRPLRVKRATQLCELKQHLQNEGLIKDATRVRLWNCSSRQNHTVRPDYLIAKGDDLMPIDSNGRDPLMHGGFNVPLYTNRHGYYGQEDMLRLYAEDLASRYCIFPGTGFTTYSKLREANGMKSMEMSPLGAVEEKTKMETESIGRPDDQRLSFPLTARETLLFLKYYTSTPSPRLQWLGHFVVDRTTRVKDLRDLLRNAVDAYQRIDSVLPGLPPQCELLVFEEVSATSVKQLEGDKTLEEHDIPAETNNGDIIVIQANSAAVEEAAVVDSETGEERGEVEIFPWNGFQEESRGDGTDLPLGGRPLPFVGSYYDYLTFRVKIEFKDKNSVGTPAEAKSIFYELSRKDSYRVARKVLSGSLGDNVDPDYIRFFAHDHNREAPVREPFRLVDGDPLERVIPMNNLMTNGQPDYRTIWYERTEYHIDEFNQKEEVRVVWRQDGGTRSTRYITKQGNVGSVGDLTAHDVSGEVQSEAKGGSDMETSSKSETAALAVEKDGSDSGDAAARNCVVDYAKHFSVLVPLESTYADVMDQVRGKLGVRSDIEMRMFDVKNSGITRFLSRGEAVPSMMTGSHDYGAELRAEPVPADETEEALREGGYILMSVVHLAKEKQAWRGPVFFGEPFVVKVRKEGEPVEFIRKRIQQKLGVPSEEFEEWPLGEISQLKMVYFERDMIFMPRSHRQVEFSSLALEHKNTAPPKRTPSTVSRYADKPLKIRS